MSFSSRVEYAFVSVGEGGSKTVNLDKLAKYLDYLRDAVKETVAASRRSVLLALLVSFFFLLLHTGALEKASLGSIEISSTSKLIVFFPPVALYFFLEAAVKANRADQQMSVFYECLRLWNANADASDLHILVSPELPLYFAFWDRSPRKENIAPFDRAYNVVASGLIVFTAFVPLGFSVYAFIALFGSHGKTDLLVWASCTVNLLLFVLYVWCLVAEIDSPEPRT